LKVFECRSCGATLRRPSPPLHCPACGQQRVGLFKLQEPAAPPAKPVPPPSPPSAKAVAPRPPAVVRPTPVATPFDPPAAPQPGSIAWRYPSFVPGDPKREPLRNCPAIDAEGRIHAALGSTLVCLEASTSSVTALWTYPTAGHIPGSPVLASDGIVRVHSADGLLHGVDRSGVRVWQVAVGEPLGWASPLVDASSNTFLCSEAGGLLRVDARGMRDPRPFFPSHRRFDSTGLLHDGVVYVGAEDAFVYAIDVRGARGTNRWDHAAGRGKTEWFINSAPAPGPDGSIIVAGRDEFLYAFDCDGQVLWKVHIRGQMLASPIVSAEGDVYVGVSLLERGRPAAGKLVCVNTTARQVHWEYEAAGPVESTPVLGSDGIVYFGDNAGIVHAVNRNSTRCWASRVGAPVRSAGTIIAPERVLFGQDDGTLVALACSSPALAAGGWPKYLGTASQATSI
jgi:outer membrane protein assembly factor BamB